MVPKPAFRTDKPEIYREQIFAFEAAQTQPAKIADAAVYSETKLRIKSHVYELLTMNGTVEEAADSVLNTFMVNAIEIVYSDGEGVVHYADWP